MVKKGVLYKFELHFREALKLMEDIRGVENVLEPIKLINKDYNEIRPPEDAGTIIINLDDKVIYNCQSGFNLFNLNFESLKKLLTEFSYVELESFKDLVRVFKNGNTG